MTPLFHLTWRSVVNRRGTVALTVVAVALAVAMLLGVERLRTDARDGFARTITGTDLLVGARSGPVQLLLYSVFHIGDATNNLSWASVEKIAANPQVAWWVPIALGDSHRGFRVVGTRPNFFDHYRFGRDGELAFSEGRAFSGLYDAVVGAEVAARLDYRTGAQIVVSHGAGLGGAAEHDDKPFEVVGVLARTGTPVDRSVLVSLEALEAIHLDWAGGARLPGLSIPADQARRFDLTPKSVTAVLVGLKSRAAVFRVQRAINAIPDEPLTAILPGVTLHALWGVVAIAERALLAVSAVVVLVGLAGLVAVVMAGLGERRRELAILRALGASPPQVFMLLVVESLFIGVLGCVFGLGLVQAGAIVAGPWLEAYHGIALVPGWPRPGEWALLGGVMVTTLGASLLPGLRAYRYAIADGMTIRI